MAPSPTEITLAPVPRDNLEGAESGFTSSRVRPERCAT